MLLHTKPTQPQNQHGRKTSAGATATPLHARRHATTNAISRPQPRARNRIWPKTCFACHPCNLVGTRATPKRYRDCGPRRAKRYAHCHFAGSSRRNGTKHNRFWATPNVTKNGTEIGRAKRYAQCHFSDNAAVKQQFGGRKRIKKSSPPYMAHTNNNSKPSKSIGKTCQNWHTHNFV